MTMKRNKGNWDLPLLHPDHPRPVTRRQFLSQGFMTGAAYTVGGVAPLLAARNARGDLSPDLDLLRASPCNITDGAGKIPFILSLIHISEPTRPRRQSRMPSSA